MFGRFQTEMPHGQLKFYFNASARSFISMKNRKISFYTNCYFSEIGLIENIVGINLIFRRTKAAGNTTVPTAERILLPLGVPFRAKSVQQSSAGTFPPRIELPLSPVHRMTLVAPPFCCCSCQLYRLQQYYLTPPREFSGLKEEPTYGCSTLRYPVPFADVFLCDMLA